MPELDQATVEYRMHLYDSASVTDQLYDMGKLLFSEACERVHSLDEKSSRMAGYSGAIVGLLISTFTIWSPALAKWAVFVVAVGSLLGIVGGVIAIASGWPKNFAMPSDTDWLEEDGFENPDRLKRYHVASLHAAIASHDKQAQAKTVQLKRARICLCIMVGCLLLALGDATGRILKNPSRLPSAGAASTAFVAR
jgi:hypothetical protein